MSLQSEIPAILSDVEQSGQIETWEVPEEMIQGWSVIRQMYTTLTREQYQERLDALRNYDYRQFAYMSNEGQCLGVVGLWFLPRIWCGLQVDIDNFVVDHNARSLGIGKALLDHCITFAKTRGAAIATLDTFVDNPSSHRFYFREDFTIRGYHFVKPLRGQSIWGSPHD